MLLNLVRGPALAADRKTARQGKKHIPLLPVARVK
jgi:hypothetical protein